MRIPARRGGTARRRRPDTDVRRASCAALLPLEPRLLLAAQAELVTDVNTSPRDGAINHLFRAGDYIYFTADDGSTGNELYRTDGTPGGSILLKDINRGPAGSAISSFAYAGGLVYFLAVDVDHGQELWCTDGTPAGTRIAFETIPGPARASIGAITAGGDRVYFRLTTPGTNSQQLWTSDGTPGGTRQLTGIDGVPALSSIVPGAATGGGTFLFKGD